MTNFDQAVGALAKLADNVGRPMGDGAEFTGLLPAPHHGLLGHLNGFTVYNGAFRMLGVRPEQSLDIRAWNDPDLWKFAWGNRLDMYLIFAETAWGDQYAYRRTEAGSVTSEVYMLEATMLRAEALSDSFENFLIDELLRNARAPYDELTVGAVTRLGPISPESHWVLAPSLALGGDENLDNVVQIPSVTAMIYAGDIATALSAAPPDAQVRQVSQWLDASMRDRLQIDFI